MMTKKHFEALAAMIKSQRNKTHVNLDEMAGAVADLCADDNSCFDRQRFLDAAGVRRPNADTY